MKIEGRRLCCIYVISAWGETWTANSIIDVCVLYLSLCFHKTCVCLFLVIDDLYLMDAYLYSKIDSMCVLSPFYPYVSIQLQLHSPTVNTYLRYNHHMINVLCMGGDINIVNFYQALGEERNPRQDLDPK
jgi:hypothetical protein